MRFLFTRRLNLAAAAVALMALAAPILAAPAAALEEAEAKDARAVVAKLADDLSTLAARTESLPRAQSVEEAHAILRDSFDLERIAAATVGRSRFQAWDAVQRRDYVDAFIRYTLATQTGALTRYEQEKLSIDSVAEAPNGLLMVRTNYTGGDEPSTVDFMLARNEEGRLKIVDLIVDGAVSQLQLRRAEFSSVLQNKGYDGLMEILRTKTEKLLAKDG